MGRSDFCYSRWFLPPAFITRFFRKRVFYGELMEGLIRTTAAEPPAIFPGNPSGKRLEERAAVIVSESEAARIAPLRYFAHIPRSVAQSHAEFTNWKPIILGKIGDSSMALKLHLAPAYEESHS